MGQNSFLNSVGDKFEFNNCTISNSGSSGIITFNDFLNMRYHYIREQIKTGDLFFTSGDSLFSRIIRFFTGSKVSHVGIFIWLGERLFCAESIEGLGVRILPFSTIMKQKGEIRWGRVNHEYSEEELLSRIFGNSEKLPQIGEEYDMIGALLSVFYDTKSKEVFCSEYTKKILSLDFPGMKGGITPRDIANKCLFLNVIKES